MLKTSVYFILILGILTSVAFFLSRESFKRATIIMKVPEWGKEETTKETAITALVPGVSVPKKKSQNNEVVDKNALKNYVVKGISFLEADKFALIEDITTNKIKKYRETDKIEGWVIVAITRNFVVLEKMGIIAKLSMQSISDILQDNIKKISESERDIYPEIISYSIENLSEILSNNQINYDFLKRDKEIGLTINKIGDDGLLSSVGLKDGDKIKKVNGKEITGFGIGFDILGNLLLKGKQEVTVEVEREGSKIELKYNLPGLSSSQIISEFYESFRGKLLSPGN